MPRRMSEYYDARYGLPADCLRVPESAIARPQPFETIACRR